MPFLLFIVVVIIILWLVFRTPKKDDVGSASDQQTPPAVDSPSSWTDKKGQMGEEEVQRILSHLPREEYIVLNDVLLPTGNGTTQIDHVVVSLYGIFVIEAKNYKGKIYGTHDSEKWSQYINGEEFNFRNPVKQNLGHVLAVEKLTHIGVSKIIPLVVFTGSATLKVLGCDEVIYDGMLYEIICRYRNRVMSNSQMEYYAGIIDRAIDENRETKSAHVSNVRDRIVLWDQEVNAGLCPRCDGHLVLRKGKFGDFYGCSNYPKCRYTKNL